MEPSREVCRELSLEVSDVGCVFAIAFPDPSTLLRRVNKTNHLYPGGVQVYADYLICLNDWDVSTRNGGDA